MTILPVLHCDRPAPLSCTSDLLGFTSTVDFFDILGCNKECLAIENPVRFSDLSRWTKRRRVDAMLKSWSNANDTSVEVDSLPVGDSVTVPMVEVSFCCQNSEYVSDDAISFISDKDSSYIKSSDERNTDEFGDTLPDWDINWSDSGYLGNVTCSEESDNDDCGSELNLSTELVSWMGSCNITHTAVDRLLHVLHAHHPELPLTCKTLLRQSGNLESVKVNIQNIPSGEYVHFGILTGLLLFREIILEDHNPTILYQVNIDGLPLFKSSGIQLWPILGQLVGTKKPFIIGCFCGSSKPTEVESFLNDFVREAKELERGFTLEGRQLIAKIACFLCDSPARAFVKQVKSHTGYNGCDRCVQKGLYVAGRMTYPETHAIRREDSEFGMISYEGHQLAKSPLAQLDVGLVSAFVLDYMHLVCLGVVRRLLVFWRKGPLKVRISALCVRIISDKLLSLANFMPSEFARKPRSLLEMDRWKATEFRQFLLYTGPIVIKSQISGEQYENFMCLSVAIYLLLSPRLCRYYCTFAEDLLVRFVKTAAKLYGPEFVVYNVHCLVHLGEDVRKFGNLDKVSCFPFENFLGKVKKCVRKPQVILQQITNRMNEGYFMPHIPKKVVGTIAKEHTSGPMLASLISYKQYKELYMADFTIKISTGDNCISYEGGHVALVRNICSNGSDFSLIIQRFRQIEPAFDKPLDSTDIGIYHLRNLHTRLEICDISRVRSKYVTLLMESNDGWLGIPLLHVL